MTDIVKNVKFLANGLQCMAVGGAGYLAQDDIKQILDTSDVMHTAAQEITRLRALVEEAKRVLEPFAVVDPMDVYESEDEDANGRYVLTQANFRAARALRDRLGVKG